MSQYELQVKTADNWQIIDVFFDFDEAYGCARRIERGRSPDELRIIRVDELRSGISRARTVYTGGLKPRREARKQQERAEQEARKRRVQDRVMRKLVNEETRRNARRASRKDVQSHPVYLTCMSLSLSLTGLTALYLVHKMLLP